MKVLVLGLGIHGGGAAAATYFAHRGDEVRVSDNSTRDRFGKIPAELEKLGVICIFGQQDRELVEWADVVIKNPAISSSNPILAFARKLGNDFSFLFSHPAIGSIKIIAVTGTKGKSTTVSSIAHVLHLTGHECFVCGNLGVSAFFALEEIDRRLREKQPLFEYLVCELSSWQIHDTHIALNGLWPYIRIAMITSIYADHQNSYHSIDGYHRDKFLLFGPHCQKALVPRSVKTELRENTAIARKKITTIPSPRNPYLLHNQEYACAFEALRELGFKRKTIIQAMKSFKGIPHRIEQVAIIDNIMYINDSAATISEAVTFSMNNIKPLAIHLICGGTDKDLSADGMTKAVKWASTVTLLDGTFTQRKLIPLLLRLHIPYAGPYRTMEEAVEKASKEACSAEIETGLTQVVLLSPGAASFELFSNEFDRGDQFRNYVLKLKNTGEGIQNDR